MGGCIDRGSDGCIWNHKVNLCVIGCVKSTSGREPQPSVARAGGVTGYRRFEKNSDLTLRENTSLKPKHIGLGLRVRKRWAMQGFVIGCWWVGDIHAGCNAHLVGQKLPVLPAGRDRRTDHSQEGELHDQHASQPLHYFLHCALRMLWMETNGLKCVFRKDLFFFVPRNVPFSLSISIRHPRVMYLLSSQQPDPIRSVGIHPVEAEGRSISHGYQL